LAENLILAKKLWKISVLTSVSWGDGGYFWRIEVLFCVVEMC